MRKGLAAVLVLGALAALVPLGMRARLEAGYRTVEIVLDAQDWLTLIRREGRDVGEVMRDLRRRGATSVALSDVTLKHLAEEGVVSYASGGTLQSLSRVADLVEPFRALAAAGLLRPGATVKAKVYCGKRSIGYAWLHDAINFVRSRVLFPMNL
jgi:hypothetical protein